MAQRGGLIASGVGAVGKAGGLSDGGMAYPGEERCPLYPVGGGRARHRAMVGVHVQRPAPYHPTQV
jgi:hypothetical protein